MRGKSKRERERERERGFIFCNKGSWLFRQLMEGRGRDGGGEIKITARTTKILTALYRCTKLWLQTLLYIHKFAILRHHSTTASIFFSINFLAKCDIYDVKFGAFSKLTF